MLTVLKNKMDEVASVENIQQRVAEGTFINQSSNSNVLVFPGATYGFCVRLNTIEHKAVFLEAQQKGTARLNKIQDWKPIQDDIYPLYWGKEKYAGERVNRHLKNNSQGTGILRLCAYASLHNKEIACVSLTVANNTDFEKAMQRNHPDLLKTSNSIF